jgi:rhodanese-related sulfurtransferase
MSDKRINYIIWLMMLGMFGYFAYGQGWIFSNFKNLSTEEAYDMIEHDKNITLIDVRSAKEYQRDCIANAINIPFSEMEENLSRVSLYKKRKIVIYSERGKRSIDASRLLGKEGFSVFHINGGVVFWVRKGYTIRKH